MVMPNTMKKAYTAYKNDKSIDEHRQPGIGHMKIKLFKPIYLCNKYIKEYNDIEYGNSIDYDDLDFQDKYWEVEHLFKRLIIHLEEDHMFNVHNYDTKLTLIKPEKLSTGRKKYYNVKFEYEISLSSDYEYQNDKCEIIAQLY